MGVSNCPYSIKVEGSNNGMIQCPKCGQRNVIIIGKMYKCNKCGNTWDKNDKTSNRASNSNSSMKSILNDYKNPIFDFSMKQRNRPLEININDNNCQFNESDNDKNNDINDNMINMNNTLMNNYQIMNNMINAKNNNMNYNLMNNNQIMNKILIFNNNHNFPLNNNMNINLMNNNNNRMGVFKVMNNMDNMNDMNNINNNMNNMNMNNINYKMNNNMNNMANNMNNINYNMNNINNFKNINNMGINNKIMDTNKIKNNIGNMNHMNYNYNNMNNIGDMSLNNINYYMNNNMNNINNNMNNINNFNNMNNMDMNNNHMVITKIMNNMNNNMGNNIYNMKNHMNKISNNMNNFSNNICNNYNNNKINMNNFNNMCNSNNNMNIDMNNNMSFNNNILNNKNINNMCNMNNNINSNNLDIFPDDMNNTSGFDDVSNVEKNANYIDTDKIMDNVDNMNHMNNMNDNMNNINNNMNNINNMNNFLINIKFFDLEKTAYCEKKNLSRLLKLCLMKYLSQFFENEEILEKLEPEIKTIILKLRNSLNFTENNEKNIINLLQEQKGNNIIIYAEYIKLIVNNQIMNDIITLLTNEIQLKIDNYWRCLSKYQKYSSFFEKEFIKDLKNSIFDYSLICLGILNEEEHEEEYKLKLNECPNMKKKILYHGTQINPIAKILTDEFKYAARAFYGMGIYFTDMIDYVAFYTGGKDYMNRRDNFGNIIPVDSTFSFIASEVFYDEKKFKQIYDESLLVDELDHFPTYQELEEKYSDKMVQPNGIHFINVDNEGDQLTKSCFLNEQKEGNFLAKEYVITEKYQILPIYSLTVKRNEYFILWRDPNFKGKNEFTDYLLERKLFCMEKAKMNIYFESSTEEALKFLQRRKYNKVILITSIGLDLSGKKFIEVARKIFGFNVMVLFFSANENHLTWITKFPNCLYANTAEIYEEYITNFNEKGLKSLKKEVENEYDISLMEFSEDFLSYPNCKNIDNNFSSLNFLCKNNYLRHVKIYCQNKNKYLFLGNKKKKKIKDNDDYVWDVTIVDNEITLFSNGKYLNVDEDKETIVGYKYMIIWNYKIINGQYYFIYPNKKKKTILSMEENIIKVNKEKPGKNELFQLIDVIENYC